MKYAWMAGVLLSVVSSSASAQVLTSGGDGLGGSFASWINNPANSLNQIVFDNFNVAAGTEWNVTGLFGAFKSFSNTTPVTTLKWEIRQGMVAGSSTGTSVTSGSGSFVAVGDVFTMTVGSFALGAGSYWLGFWADLSDAVDPDPTDNSNIFFGSQVTAGANSVNALSDKKAVWLIGADGSNVGGVSNNINEDFAYGVLGTMRDVAVVPEPSTVVLLGAGLVAVGGIARRRRTLA